MQFDELSKLGTDELTLLLGAATLQEVAPDEAGQDLDHGTDAVLLRQLEQEDPKNRSLLIDVGLGILAKVSDRLHVRICGNEESEIKSQIVAAQKKGSAAIAAVLVAILTDMGLSLVIATIISTILATDVLEAAGEEFCERWGAFNAGSAATK